jgi:glutaconate CoA-transferase subunit A
MTVRISSEASLPHAIMKSEKIKTKILSMKEAVSEFIEEGCSIAIGTGLEAAIPFAAGHEIIRQNKKGLTLIGPISDMLFDQMIGAGCVRKVMAAWVGNVIMGVGYNLRRAVEEGSPRRIEIVDYSNFSMALALHAGGLGIPFIPTKTLLGTGMMEGNSPFKEMTCPYTGEKLALVPAVKPDVAIVHVQRVDEEGNPHFWGGGGVTREAAMAAHKIIVVAEELVSKRVIRKDPNRTLFPGFLASAVVIEPWGAHPSPVQGYYDRDHENYVTYHHESKDRNHFLRWLAKQVLQVKDRKDYLSQLGKGRIRSLAVKHHKKSTPVDYGY